MIVMVIIRVKIVYIGVLMRLVSITPGHVKLDWLSPSKVDRVNENDSKDNDDKNNNKSECDRDDKDDSNDNESNNESDNESDNENWMYWCNSEASE